MENSSAVVILVPIVIALTSLVKLYLDSKFAPLVSLGLGIVISFIFPAATLGLTILSGIVIGLTASGLYSGTKALAS